jgi:ankyrin repeat protein
VLQLLVEKLEAHGVNCDTCLYIILAADGGHLKCLRWLLSNEPNSAVSQILAATAAEDWEQLMGMVQEGRDDVPISRLLDHAVEHYSSASVKLLLQHGALPTSRALLAAVEGGRTSSLRLLLQHGALADSYRDGTLGSKALDTAMNRGHVRCAQLLLRQGVRLEKADATGACKSVLDAGQMPCLEYLLTCPECLASDMRWSMHFGATLVTAAWHGQLGCMKILVRLGSGALNQFMLTHALAVAANAGYTQIMQVLLQAGAQATAAGSLALQAVFYSTASANYLCSERLNAWLQHDLQAISHQGGSGAAVGTSSLAQHGGIDAEAEVEMSDAQVMSSLNQSGGQVESPSSRSCTAVVLIKAGASLPEKSKLIALARNESNQELMKLLEDDADV